MAEEDNFRKDESGGRAAFNMAVETLRRIADILREITEVSSTTFSPGVNPGSAQYRKYNLIRELYQASTPLINNKKSKGIIKKRIDEIKLKTNYDCRQYPHQTLIYDAGINYELDEIVTLIQETLQEEKYFMPPKSDPRYSWRQY